MTKKAVFIGPAYPYRGGIAAFNENLATIFQHNGWECKIFTFTQQYPNLLFPGKNQLTTEDPRPNLTITRGIYSTNPLNWLKMSKEIVAENPDLVITQYWMPFMAPAFGTILRGVKKEMNDVQTVTIVHNFKPHESRIGDKQLNKYLTNRTDILTCLSASVKREIEKSVADKPIIQLFHPIYDHYGAPLSQEVAKTKLGWDEDTKYLLFFGLVRAYKGVDTLLDALTILKTKENYKLVIAGEFYEDEKKYLKQIAKNKLEDRIIIRNEYIPNEDVPLLFCGSDAIVLPYKTATQSGVVPIALHFDRPVIVTKVGSLSPMIEKHKIGLIAESNTSSIAEKLEDFLEGKEKLKSDFENIKDELSWQSFFESFMENINAIK